MTSSGCANEGAELRSVPLLSVVVGLLLGESTIGTKSIV